jgi:hypothetical protein
MSERRTGKRKPTKRRRRKPQLAPVVWPQAIRSILWPALEDVADAVDAFVKGDTWGREFMTEVEDGRADRD